MALVVRKCKLEDAAAITELNRLEMGYEYPAEATEDKLKKLLSDSSCLILVAEYDGRVVGYVHAEEYELLYFPTMVNIMGIAVSSDCRRMGVGKALMAGVEKWADEIGAEAVRLVSGAERKAAHKFYESAGFTPGKTQINFRKNI